MKTKDKAYTANYQPLEEWLHRTEGRCAWQKLIGDENATHAYMECWIWPNGRQAIIMVQSHNRGWDIFTNSADPTVAATLDDANRRLGITKAEVPTAAPPQ